METSVGGVCYQHYRFPATAPAVGPITIFATAASAICLIAAYLIPPLFFGLSTWSTTAAPSAADAIFVPFTCQGIVSDPTLIAACC